MADMTIVDIAKLAGVSVSTVSRVLNNHPDVSEKAYKSVTDAIEKYHYVPNNSARNLKRESLKAIAVVIKEFYNNSLFNVMLSIIQHELEQNDYAMILSQVDADEDELAAAISLCKEKKPRGIIFMGGKFHHTKDEFSRVDIPIVVLTIKLDDDVDRESYSSVTIDDYAAGYRVGQIAQEYNHKKMAVIGAGKNDVSVSRLRIDGFRQSLQDRGLYCDEDMVEYAGTYTHKSGYEATRKLLARYDFTFLFCVSDIMAFGAIRAIHDAGLMIPKDISVVGFDGIEEGRYYIPSLATMKQPEVKMAKEGVRIILQNIRNRASTQHQLFHAVFSEGESIAPCST